MNHTNWNPQTLPSYASALNAAAGLQASAPLPLVSETLARLSMPETGAADLLVCDSQPVTAAGVRALLANVPNIFVLPNCDSLTACRAALREHTPQIIMLDKALGMQALLEWLTDLRITFQGRSAPAVVVWGVSMTEAEALRFLQAGARGIVRKTSPAEVLVACLEAVAQGRTWMEDTVFRHTPSPERYHRSELTPREQQVMELVEQGLKNREIARELGIRPGTVKIHLKHIFEKTGVRGRYGLALSGMREKGILAVDAADGDE
ncbi:MAG: response regulator transcription factor [Bryobacteraceae bacterium]|nr:response regulator transcription factor [Bryobacteraceae bacterium]